VAELVGEAFVRITADTTAMRRAIKRAAGEAADEYTSEFGKRVEAIADARLARAREQLARAMVDPSEFDVMARKFKTTEEAAHNFRMALAELTNQEKFSKLEMRDFNAAITAWEKSTIKATKAVEQQTEAEAAAAEATRIRDMRLKNFFRTQEIGLRRSREALRDMVDTSSGFTRVGRRIDYVGDRVAILGDRVGRVFGKGARNNFLNLFGRSVDFLISGPMRALVEITGKATQGVGALFETFQKAQRGGVSFGGAIGKTLAVALRAAIPLLAAFTAVVVAGSIALPVIASGAFLLAGALTAVVGAISLGIIGGLLALVPAAAAVVGAVGVIALAFADANEEGTKAAAAIDKLKKSWADFKRETQGTSTSIVEALTRVADKILDLSSLFVKNMGEAIVEVANHFGSLLDRPEVRNFITAFSTVLPRIFENFGRGFNNLLIGLLGFFGAILGPAERLSQGFERLTERFREFTLSAEGQNKIKTWMDTAFTAAESLWSILGNVFSILGKIFTAGTTGAGQDFLTYLDEVTTRFDKWLSTPEGQQAVVTFFEDVRDVMRDVKTALEEAGEALDNLDTAQAREDFKTLLDAVNLVAEAFRFISSALGYVRLGLSILTDPVDRINEAFQTIIENVDLTAESFTGLQTALGWAQVALRLLADPVTAIAAAFAWLYEVLFGNSYIPDIVNGFREWLPQIPQIIVTTFAQVPALFLAPFQQAYTGVISLLATLPGRIFATLFGVPGMVAAALAGVYHALPTPFRDAIANALRNLSTLPGKVVGILSRIPGMITSTLSSLISRLPTPFRTGAQNVINAITGLPARVRGIISRIPGMVTSALGGLASRFSAPFAAAYRVVSGWVSSISGLISGIIRAVSSAASTVRRTIANLPSFPRFASGGVLYGPTTIVAGEAGREAIVPLDRPLSMVDPSVRDLAAYAQGKPRMAAGGVAGSGQVNVMAGAIVIHSNQNAALIAQEVIDKITEQFR
jgi:hypothetical protein